MKKRLMMKIIDDIWFKRRDIISSGFDESLEYLAKIIPLKIFKVPTGTKCWTWTVPERWEVGEAYVEEVGGKRIIDVSDHPLHVLSYSTPIDKIVTRAELLKHLHSRPGNPDTIPFEFKYYERDWGFCLQHNKLKEINKKRYRVKIASKFLAGDLKVGEFVVKGKIKDEIVIVAHLCHPAMVNDDLVGVAVLIDLATEIAKKKNKYTYRFLLVPETIGSVAYLSQKKGVTRNMKYGIFLEMLGTENSLALQFSRQGDTKIDFAAKHVLDREGNDHREGAFRKIVGNDEMVFNGPGINIPMISISRAPYPEYHSSADNPSIIKEEKLLEAKKVVLKIMDILEKDYCPKRTFTGPVFLSGMGLWVDWRVNRQLNNNIEQITLNLEGDKSVLNIAQMLQMDFQEVWEYLEKFIAKKLIEKL